MQALDIETGEVKWESKVFDWHRNNATSIAAPVYCRGLVYIGNSGSEFLARGRVTALGAETGEIKWKFWTTGSGSDPVADPTWRATPPESAAPASGTPRRSTRSATS